MSAITLIVRKYILKYWHASVQFTPTSSGEEDCLIGCHVLCTVQEFAGVPGFIGGLCLPGQVFGDNTEAVMTLMADYHSIQDSLVHVFKGQP